ncbi:MAG TPA: hypothetical protein VHK01_18040 [Lacipirellulaceae bacterium]|nr:hypothetical protein [Lacipirellulaceae bacterium]
MQSRLLRGHILGVRRSDEPAKGQPLQDDAWLVADAYVRGADLVATYKPTNDWPFSPQIYWRIDRANAAEQIASQSLLISVQTHLLETWPRISIESHLNSDEVLVLSPRSDSGAISRPLDRGDHVFHPSTSMGCIVRRLAGLDFSYVEIMSPSDYRELRINWSADGASHADWLLFADFLEKGVIWRARLQSVLVPRENDIEHAISCCRADEQRPLPLTT